MAHAIPARLLELISEFDLNEVKYKSREFKEQWAREQFIDPLLQILGWSRGSVTDPAWDGYISEDRVVTATATRAPDYGCYFFGRRAFYVEAKAPSVRIAASRADAFQVRSYGWSAGVPLSILTDFEEIAVYDCRTQPAESDDPAVSRIRYFEYGEWGENWQWFSELFSRSAVETGSLEHWAQAFKPDQPSVPVSSAFLRSVERWRLLLAEEIVERNPTITEWKLSDATQLLLDRLIFLRIAEARSIEADRTLLDSVEHENAYSRLVALFSRAENRFNSSLFHFTNHNGQLDSPDLLTPTLNIGDDTLLSIVRDLYPPASPYEFAAIPAEILGEVYEQFLGSRIRLTNTGDVEVEAKPETKNAGGVVYTPSEVVRYMLGNSLNKLLDGASVAKIAGSRKGAEPLRILDPACGSGSFLIQAYELLVRWYLEQYEADTEKWSKGRSPRIVQRGGRWALTIDERKRILRDHVYGVDIDAQAVEVTKLSLLLKTLEGEDADTLGQQLQLIHDRALPDLSGNIRSGNSLIEPNFMELDDRIGIDENRTRSINPFRYRDEFPHVFGGAKAGFDLVIGNPPYVLLQDVYRDDVMGDYYVQNYASAAYKLDLYHLFIERSLQLVGDRGLVSLIVPSNFMTNNHLRSLRSLMLDGGLAAVQVVDSGVFPRRSVDTAIFLCGEDARKSKQIDTCRLELTPTGLQESGFAPIEVNNLTRTPELLLVPTLAGAEESLQRMEQAADTLGSIAHVNFGKQLRDRRKFEHDVIKVDSEDEILAPHRACYTGENVERYRLEWGGLACLDDPVAQRGGTWNADRQDAVGKLLTRQIGKWPEWGIDTVGRQCLNTVFMVNIHSGQYSPHALLSVLNTAMVRAYWVGRYWDQRRTFPKIKGTYLKRIPIPVATSDDVAELDAAGKRLVHLHAEDSDSNRRLRIELMRAVEIKVAQMYGLDSGAHDELIQLLRA